MSREKRFGHRRFLLALTAIAMALPQLGCKRRAAAPPSPVSSMNANTLRATPVQAGYGGVGPYIPAPRPDQWVILLVDVETDAPLTGVEVSEVQLLDAAGRVVARAVPPFSLRRASVRDGGPTDLSEAGTTEFDGRAQPGGVVRVRLHAPLDTRGESFAAPVVSFKARVRAAGHDDVWIAGPIAAWSTA